MSSLAWEFSPKSNHTAPFVELKKLPPFTTLRIFDPNSSVLVSLDHFNRGSQSSFSWNLRKKKNAVYGENSSCYDSQEHKKRVKQHFRFSYNKTFSKLLSLSCHKRIEYTRKAHTRLICLFRRQLGEQGVRVTTKDPWLKVCFSQLLLTKLSGFEKFLCAAIGSDRTSTIHKVVSLCSAFLSDHSKCLCFLRTLPKKKKKKICRFLTDRGYELNSSNSPFEFTL